MAKTVSTKSHPHPKGEFPRYLQFRNRHLPAKAREYQHEIGHITSDLLSINRKMQRSLALSRFIIETIGKPKVGYRISGPKDFEIFEDLLYHMENFVYRTFAYRDKLALFLNFALDAPFEEGEMNLIKRFLTLKESKRNRINTEVQKFYKNPIKDILEKRKVMSHRAYYKAYNPFFLPDVTPEEIGLRKSTIAWRKKMVGEAEAIDYCLVKIFEINTNITRKIINHLSKK